MKVVDNNKKSKVRTLTDRGQNKANKIRNQAHFGICAIRK